MVAAGSRHFSGNRYTTIVDVPPVPMPQRLFDELRVGQDGKADPPASAAAPTSIAEGSRNASLTQLAGKLRRNGLSDEVSSAGESHPRALSEPYVNLSAHTAPAVEPRRTPICQ